MSYGLPGDSDPGYEGPTCERCGEFVTTNDDCACCRECRDYDAWLDSIAPFQGVE